MALCQKNRTQNVGNNGINSQLVSNKMYVYKFNYRSIIWFVHT